MEIADNLAEPWVSYHYGTPSLGVRTTKHLRIAAYENETHGFLSYLFIFLPSFSRWELVTQTTQIGEGISLYNNDGYIICFVVFKQ